MIASEYQNQSRLLLQILPLLKKYPDFALKGGTALNFFIRDLPRLSVDIDLCYVPLGPRTPALEAIRSAMEALSVDIQKRFPSSRTDLKLNGDGVVRSLLVQNEGVSVKVEPNTVIRGTVFPVKEMELKPKVTELFQMEISFPVLSLQDLYGGKICAALDRQHPRDLFDIKLLLDEGGLNTDVLEAFVVYLASHTRPMAEILEPALKDLSRTYKAEFQYMTNEPISAEELAGVRAELIRRIHFGLTDKQRCFLLSFKRGNPDWSLLSLPHICELPAIQWKLKNILSMDPGKRSTASKKLQEILFSEEKP